MKTKLTVLYVLAFVFSKSYTFSQSTILSNLRTNPFAFVGWTPGGGGTPGPLDIRNDFNQPMRFLTSASTFERVRIFEGGLSPSAPLGGGLAITSNPISPIFSPASLLHIGVDVGVLSGSIGLAGWRNWMSVGTYYAAGNDNMYVGAKQEGGPDRNDAVINWGDNAAGGPGGAPDYLRFIFTGSFNNGPVGTSTSIDGLEVMRSSPFGRVGIGNYFNNPINPALLEPARRLEILSDKPNFTANGNPQFRITHTPTQTAPIVVAGKYTDFHTTNQGDIVINPRNDGIVAPLLKDRFVGIHTNLPGNTLEINSQLLSPVTANGALLRVLVRQQVKLV